MRCLLEGNVIEKAEIPIPHGKITIELSNVNPNYAFFVRNFWKGLDKQLKLKFGTCHLGQIQETQSIDSAQEPKEPTLNPNWLVAMEQFQCYTTKGGRFAITARFVGKDSLPHLIRMNRATSRTLHRNFLDAVEPLL
jgi:hypothetical protein